MPGSRSNSGTRAKAIRLVREHAGGLPECAAITTDAGQPDMSAETSAQVDPPGG
jgi:hypothetical protein